MFAKWLNKEQIEWVFTVHYYEENGFNEQEIKNHWKDKIPSLTEDKFRKFYKKEIEKNRSKANKYQIKDFKKHPYGIGRLTANSTRARQMVAGGIEIMKKRITNDYFK